MLLWKFPSPEDEIKAATKLLICPGQGAAPVKYRDPVYQMPVKLGVHGNYLFRLAAAYLLFIEVTGLGDSDAVAQAKRCCKAASGKG